MLVERWYEARLLWLVKGYSMDDMADEVQKGIPRWPRLADLHLSGSSLQRKSKSNHYAPKELVELTEELVPRPGQHHQRMMEIVESGLRVIRGQPRKPSDLDPQVIAKALADHFSTEDVALKLADALAKLASQAAGNGSLLDVFAQAIAGRLPHVPKLKTAKLARLLAKRLNSFGAKHVAIAGGVGGVVACVVGVLLYLALPSRSSLPSAPVRLSVYISAGGVPVLFEPQSFLGAAQMGEKAPLDQHIPSGPLPGQKLPPCDVGLGQSEINAGCWWGSKDAKPPCGRLFRRGDTCYVPVAADPPKPVGSDAGPTPAR